MSERRVVITGIGVVTPLGWNLEQFWQSLLAGKSGIGPITRFDAAAFKARIAGEVKNFNVADYLSPKEARRMDVFIHYGMAAGIQAFKESGLVVTPENADRLLREGIIDKFLEKPLDVREISSALRGLVP